eukprot:m.58895 g.58895  ORF g.58895 m.58895 type:complete len:124 (-) comp49206_c0_seq4:251-622(-)
MPRSRACCSWKLTPSAPNEARVLSGQRHSFLKDTGEEGLTHAVPSETDTVNAICDFDWLELILILLLGVSPTNFGNVLTTNMIVAHKVTATTARLRVPTVEVSVSPKNFRRSAGPKPRTSTSA